MRRRDLSTTGGRKPAVVRVAPRFRPFTAPAAKAFPMKLIWKFNLVLLTIFALGFVIAGFISYRALEANAREETVQNARLMMEAARASVNYTTTQVKPLLEVQMRYTFLPQSVPAYAATEVFNDVRKNHPEFAYKEATLNPS